MSTRTGEIVRTRKVSRASDEVDPTIKRRRDETYYTQHSGRLQDRVVLLMGADDDIGYAAAMAFAREGASIVMTYQADGAGIARTQWQIEQEGSTCVGLSGSLSDPRFCTDAIGACLSTFGRLDIVVNNYALRYPAEVLASMADEKLCDDMQRAIVALYHLTGAALRYVTDPSNIIHTLNVIAQSASQGNGVKDVRGTKQKLAQTFTHLFQNRNGIAAGMRLLDMTAVSDVSDVSDVSYRNNTEPGLQDQILLSCMLFVSSDGSLMSGKMFRAGSK